jgi:hypothetical protein
VFLRFNIGRFDLFNWLFVSAAAAGAGKTSYRAIMPFSIWSSRWQ